ncbi:MAG: hypothetical protein RL500_1790 [Pseudomonadota bacterium]|jgi:hypothetical protein
MNFPSMRPAIMIAAAGLLAACASGPSHLRTPEGWQVQALPGKSITQYRSTTKDGRVVIEARAERSASLLRRKLTPPEVTPTEVVFSWRVDALMPQASVADAEVEDAAARVVFGFDGDRSRLSGRNRALFDLAETLTGEAPPFATLMYVWDPALPVDTVVVNPRTDRIRKIVVDSGTQHLGRWREHRRNLAEDYRRAFGEEPGALVSVAKMTDSDNTRSQAKAWYGAVTWATPGR